MNKTSVLVCWYEIGNLPRTVDRTLPAIKNDK